MGRADGAGNRGWDDRYDSNKLSGLADRPLHRNPGKPRSPLTVTGGRGSNGAVRGGDPSEISEKDLAPGTKRRVFLRSSQKLGDVYKASPHQGGKWGER